MTTDSNRAVHKVLGAVRTAAATAAAGLGGGLLYSRFAVDHQLPLPNAVEAQRIHLQAPQAGGYCYYVDATAAGRPLVLIHSVNAGPSAYEMRPLFEHYRGRRPVYALDLPGFGHAERSDRVYSPQLYADTINHFLSSALSEPADLVALSLGSEFAARTAVDRPDGVRSLALISPTGFGPSNIRTPSDALYRTFAFPLWSQSFFDLLASRRSIRYFLGQSFVGEPPQAFLDYAYATTHRPGARYAPLYFISGQLFTWDARTSLYAQVDRPTLVLYDQDPNVRFDRLAEFVAANPHWRAERIAPSRGLPHWDQLPATAAALDRFWEALP